MKYTAYKHVHAPYARASNLKVSLTIFRKSLASGISGLFRLSVVHAKPATSVFVRARVYNRRSTVNSTPRWMIDKSIECANHGSRGAENRASVRDGDRLAAGRRKKKTRVRGIRRREKTAERIARTEKYRIRLRL